MMQVPPFRHGIRLQSKPRVKFVIVPSNVGGVCCCFSVVVVGASVVTVAVVLVVVVLSEDSCGASVKNSGCGYPVCGIVSPPVVVSVAIVVLDTTQSVVVLLSFVCIVVCSPIIEGSVIATFVFSSASVASVVVVCVWPPSVVVLIALDSSPLPWPSFVTAPSGVVVVICGIESTWLEVVSTGNNIVVNLSLSDP